MNPGNGRLTMISGDDNTSVIYVIRHYTEVWGDSLYISTVEISLMALVSVIC